jgi:hypothetical protein
MNIFYFTLGALLLLFSDKIGIRKTVYFFFFLLDFIYSYLINNGNIKLVFFNKKYHLFIQGLSFFVC